MLSNIINKVQYTISGTPAASYPVTFPYWAKDEILAIVTTSDGRDVDLVEATNYTLTDPDDTGTMTRVGSWAALAIRLTIYRWVEEKQETDFRNGDVLDADAIEREFDRAVARAIQLDEIASRQVTVPITDPTASLELPGAEERANSVLGFDADGDAVAIGGTTGSVAVSVWWAAILSADNALESQIAIGLIPEEAEDAISAFIQSLLDDADLSAAQTTLGVSAYIKTLLDDADAAAARTTLGLGSIATRKLTVSTDPASGGSEGDIWFQVEA